MAGRSQPYPLELRERAVRMVVEVTPNYDSQWAAINAVAQKWDPRDMAKAGLPEAQSPAVNVRTHRNDA